MKTLLKVGGASFFLSYLEQVCSPGADTKWVTVDAQRTALRAVLQHERVAQTRITSLDSEIEGAKDEQEALAKDAPRRKKSEEDGEGGVEADSACVAATLSRCAEELAVLKASLVPLHRGVGLLISLSMRRASDFEALLPLWLKPGADLMPTTALAGAARQFARDIAENEAGYSERRSTSTLIDIDFAHERMILAMVTTPNLAASPVATPREPSRCTLPVQCASNARC